MRAAIRVDNWKLITGLSEGGWIAPPEDTGLHCMPDIPPYLLSTVSCVASFYRFLAATFVESLEAVGSIRPRLLISWPILDFFRK